MEKMINKLNEYQLSLEDALRLETTPKEVKETKYGKQLFKYIKNRRRAINRVIKILKEI